MKHILAEKPFLSLQGEGMWSGKPSIFVRYAGCNLRCQFGLKCKNEGIKREIPDYIQEVIDNLDNYKDVQDLPVFPTYCDTYIGILGEFAKYWVTYNSEEELANEIFALLEDKPYDINDIDLVFTGGEPMLVQENIITLLEYINNKKQKGLTVTIETNGTIPLREDIEKRFYDFHKFHCEFTFSISPKISSANYTFDETCKPAVPAQYERVADFVILKYVVKDEDDIELVKKYTKAYEKEGFIGNGIFLMPCGGKADPDFDKTQVTVFDLCVKYGYNFSPRLQMIKKNAWAV
ncbi:7-carboxy-7-deazaguanine synthase QueE [bacterium]|nr:7-carboxy-7-deazaguanine synthase QueE [bacterium]